MAKKGRKAATIPVPDFCCPNCGKTISGIEVERVTDEPATPAEFHYELVGAIRAGKGGLLDGDNKEDGK